MQTSLWRTLASLAVVLFQLASAQQFLGQIIPNVTYPGVPGAELAYFKVTDPSGAGNNFTLVNYQSYGRDGKRVVGSNIKRAVIIIHGLNRDAGTYMANMLSALSQTTGDSNINPDSVVVNAPNFPNGDDKNVSYPYWTYPPGSKKAAAGGNQSWTTLLVWKASQWAGGGTNQYPNNKSLVSSYDVIDQLVQYYADKSRFPNINQIVVAGHSLGAQTVQRYAAVGKPMSSLGVSVPVSYWIANPNSLVWLNASRPLSTASCATYDNWRDGLAAYSSYPNIYNNDLVSGGTAAVLANYQSKNKAYARGIQDMGDDSTTCAPYTTGSNRHERFYYFINWWTPTCEAPTSATGHCDTVDLVNMGHDGGGMMASTAGRARLFTDNFYGDGARSYDIGYPRIQANVDDPFPDPAYNQTVNQTNAVVYAGNMTFAGCYTDSSIRTLSTLIYDSTSNTIEMCTAACSKAGYSIAGMEFGSQCYCGNNLGSYTQKALDLGCSTPCPGNSTESCGAPNRLSVYSNGLAVQAAAPSNPEVVGNYYFSGCHSESSSGRALSGSSYSDGKNMTLENCAAFCNGYKYFGIEYSAECYCGSYFGSGSAVIADSSCPMTCSGNPLELCGGSGALSVYQLNSDAPVSTIIQGPTTAGSAPTNTGTAASLPSSSLCPATNGMGVQDSNNNTYIIACSSDTSIGSYSNAQTVNSYFDCMIACDNAASSGCVAFTYQGGVSGQGSGTCYLKNAQGSFSAGSSSLVSGFKNATGSTGSSSATTTSAASATTTFANGSTPVVGGVTYLIEANTTYSGTTLTLSKKRAASAIGDCLNTCASSSSCVGTAFDGSVCTYFGAIDTTSKVVAVGTTFATVQSRTAASSTSSSSTAGPSGSCPSANGQTINGYVVSCSSDTNIGSYSSSQATNSYMDCMSACNASASTGCVAWTYVGGTNGQGSGTCYFKNSQGTFVSAGSNLVSGMISSQGSSSSSLSSTQSGLTTGSSSTSSGATSTASSNVCPDSQDITDSNNNIYTIKCSSDTNVGSYANGQAVTSYADCMTICDATTGCVAFTYVGGTAGQGSGICYFKNDRGSATPAGSNLVSGFLKNSVSSSASTSTTASSNILSSSVTSSSTSASSSSSASLCPAANGQIITDSNGNQYNVTCSADNSVGSYTNAQASTSYLDCMNACDFASSSGCQGFTYVGGSNGLGSGTCWLKQSMADYPASGSNFISAVKVANVKNAVVSFSSSSLTSSIVSSTSASSTTSSSTLSSSLSSSVSLSFDSSSASAAASSSSSVSSTSSTVSLSSVISSSSTVSSTTDVSLSASTSSATSTTSSSSVSFTSSSATSTTSSSSASSTSSSVSSTSSNAIIPSTRTTIVSSSSPTTLSTITSSVSSSSTALSLPTGFSSYGCFVDGNPRALAYSAGSTNTNTPYNCASTCQSLGYKYAGTEYGRECWCANAAPTTSAKSTDCNMACSGDNTQSCGAGNRLSVYVDKTWTNKFSARASYGTWNLMACYTDGTNGRVLPQTMSMTGGSNNATIANCLDACAQSGLSVCGAEYYQECYGGSNIPSSNLIAGSDPLTAGCNYPCTGNKTEACGGSNRILVYINNGTVTATSARS